MGEQVAHSADVLITVGVRSRKIAEGALEHGMSEKVIFQYDYVDRARSEIKDLIETGDIVLIKASQSIRAEILVAELMAETDLDRKREMLVRHDKDWLAKPIKKVV